MNTREQQLLDLGFEKNEDQQSYILYKYGYHWYVDFWEVENCIPQKWQHKISAIKAEMRLARFDRKEEISAKE